MHKNRQIDKLIGTDCRIDRLVGKHTHTHIHTHIHIYTHIYIYIYIYIYRFSHLSYQ